MRQDNVLILGGNSFIGRRLARKLAAEGREVFVISPNPSASAATRNVRFLQGSLDDPVLLAEALPKCGTVFHLASTTTPGTSANKPVLELDNLAPTLRLLDELQRHSETHFVFFSSGGTIYGNPPTIPVNEDVPTAPLSYHGAAKIALEAFLRVFRAKGHPVTVLRPSNAYGPGQNLKDGFGLIRTLLEHARHSTAFEIWGDGENVRDFIYIDDIADACVLLVERLQDNGTYNLGSGIGYSINQVRRIVEEITGFEIKTTHRPMRSFDVRSIVLDTSRVEAKLFWKPKTSLEEGIRLTWDWELQQR